MGNKWEVHWENLGHNSENRVGWSILHHNGKSWATACKHLLQLAKTEAGILVNTGSLHALSRYQLPICSRTPKLSHMGHMIRPIWVPLEYWMQNKKKTGPKWWLICCPKHSVWMFITKSGATRYGFAPFWARAERWPLDAHLKIYLFEK